MKIAFVYHWNEGPHSGVQRKVRMQTEAWARAGHEVRRIIVCRNTAAQVVLDEGQDVFPYASGLDRLRVWTRVARAVLDWQPNVVYHRFDLYSPGLVQLARRIPLVLEINTDDVEEYALQGRGRAAFNRLTRGRLISAAAGHVFVTRELARSSHFARYNRPSIVLSNGTSLSAAPAMPPGPTGGSPRWVFVGTPGQPWQGVDKLPELARAWPDAHFDVVGSGPQDLPGSVPDNLTLHGYLDRDHYQQLLQDATAAFGSLALHRKGMQEASPLKVREYLAAGVPVALAYQDTDFPQGAPFLLPLPNTEDNLVPHLARLQAFAQEWQGRRVSRESVSILDSAGKEQSRLAFMESMARNTKSPSILLLTTALTYGGAEVQVVELARGLKRRGWQVHVVSMVAPVAFTTQLRAAGVTVHSLDMSPGRPSARAMRRWVSIVRSVRPDIVHSHMIHANLLGRLSRLFVRMPALISTAHNIDEGGGWRIPAYRLTDSLADLTTNVSDAATERYVRDGLTRASRIQTVPNGVRIGDFAFDPAARNDLREKLGLQDSFVWLCVGRIAPAKNHTLLLRAFAPLAQANPHAALVLVGEGEMERDIRHLSRVYGIERQVHFLGRRDDVARLMSAADAFVLSSDWEGLPMVLLEAGASGLPIVATNVGGNGETFAPTKAHHLIAPRNAGALQSAMSAVMALPEAERRAAGTANARKIQEQFSLDVVLDRWEALYGTLGAPVKRQ